MFEAIRTPQKVWPIWLIALTLPVGLVGVAYFYYPALQSSGTLGHSADSIGIPVFGTAVLALLLTPFVLGLTAACVLRYKGSVSLAYWDKMRPARSTIITFLFGVPILAATAGIAYDLSQGWPWYEYLWEFNTINFMAWLALLRAALLSRLSSNFEQR